MMAMILEERLPNNLVCATGHGQPWDEHLVEEGKADQLSRSARFDVYEEVPREAVPPGVRPTPCRWVYAKGDTV